jgi:type 1 fimbria pilin
LPVTLSNFSHKATIVSNPSCESTGQSVIVTGELVGQGSNGSATGVGAVIYDSHGTFIGDGETPLLTVHPGQTVPFKLTATVQGTAASSDISWGIGPTGSTTGTPVGSSPAGGT